MADARIEQLGEPRTYEKEINGIRHGVIELRYAIFPQKSGQLSIPAQVFSATLVERSGQNDYQPFGPRPGRLTRVSSPEIPLTVKAKPAEYPADAPWLPARNLTLAEAWNPEPDKAQVGDSLTRSLMVKVEGLASAQLPALPATHAPGLRRYPDQPQLSNQASERGVLGSREEREALVPTTSGRIELPPVEVVWWNTREDHLERSQLPGRTLEVANNPALEPEAPVESANDAQRVVEGPLLWPWKLATLLLALTTLLGFGLWWHARRQPAILPTAQTGPSPRTLLDDLKRACLANDPTPRARPWTPGRGNNRKPWRTWPHASCRCPTPWMASTAPSTARAASTGRARSCGRPSAPCQPAGPAAGCWRKRAAAALSALIRTRPEPGCGFAARASTRERRGRPRNEVRATG